MCRAAAGEISLPAARCAGCVERSTGEFTLSDGGFPPSPGYQSSQGVGGGFPSSPGLTPCPRTVPSLRQLSYFLKEGDLMLPVSFFPFLTGA